MFADHLADIGESFREEILPGTEIYNLRLKVLDSFTNGILEQELLPFPDFCMLFLEDSILYLLGNICRVFLEMKSGAVKTTSEIPHPLAVFRTVFLSYSIVSLLHGKSIFQLPEPSREIRTLDEVLDLSFFFAEEDKGIFRVFLFQCGVLQIFLIFFDGLFEDPALDPRCIIPEIFLQKLNTLPLTRPYRKLFFLLHKRAKNLQFFLGEDDAVINILDPEIVFLALPEFFENVLIVLQHIFLEEAVQILDLFQRNYLIEEFYRIAFQSEKSRIILSVLLEFIVDFRIAPGFEGIFQFQNGRGNIRITQDTQEIGLYGKLVLRYDREFFHSVRGIGPEKRSQRQFFLGTFIEKVPKQDAVSKKRSIISPKKSSLDPILRLLIFVRSPHITYLRPRFFGTPVRRGEIVFP